MTKSIYDDSGENERVSSMEKQKEDHNIPYILQLPSHLLGEIFNKIQIKTLVQCRFVCKFWHRLLSDPEFTEQLFSRRTCLLLRGCGSDHLATLKNDSLGPNDVALKLLKDTIVLPKEVNIVSSCNGLLCFYKVDSWNPPYGRLYISNPITGESLALPSPPGEYETSFPSGFGFSPMSGAYKLVLFRPKSGWDDEPFLVVLVLTVGSGAWRCLGQFSYKLDYMGVCVSGFLHWMDWSRALICAFDLEREIFQELPLPPSWDSEGRNNISRLGFSVLQGCLSVTVTVGSQRKMSIWVMKEHGVKESWSLELTIGGVVVQRTCQQFFQNGQIWLMLEDGPVLLKFGDGQVLLFNGGKLLAYASGKGLVDVEFDGIHFISAHVHIPSFVSPKHIIRGWSSSSGSNRE
ncbi:unnamed protein product [Prunus armeniaca]